MDIISLDLFGSYYVFVVCFVILTVGLEVILCCVCLGIFDFELFIVFLFWLTLCYFAWVSFTRVWCLMVLWVLWFMTFTCVRFVMGS